MKSSKSGIPRPILYIPLNMFTKSQKHNIWQPSFPTVLIYSAISSLQSTWRRTLLTLPSYRVSKKYRNCYCLVYKMEYLEVSWRFQHYFPMLCFIRSLIILNTRCSIWGYMHKLNLTDIATVDRFPNFTLYVNVLLSWMQCPFIIISLSWACPM